MIAEHLVNGLILSAAIFLGSILLFRFLLREQRWSAATRHRVLLLTFFVLASTPILTALKPTRPSDSLPRTGQLLAEQPWPTEIQMFSGVAVPSEANRSTPQHHWRQPGFWLRWIDWPVALAVLWTMLVLVYFYRLAAAINRLRLLHRSARPLTVSTDLTFRRKITIAESSRISSPVAVGLWSPKVLLPSNFQSGFSVEDRANVLRHEIAHLERFDDWSNLAQQLFIALFPINPFLWILRKRLQLQEEIACDDWALAGADQPKNYASLLTRLAASYHGGPSLVSGVSRGGKHLYRRVSRILDKNCNRSLKPSWRSTLLAGLGLIFSLAGGLFWLPAVVWTSPAQAAEVQNTPANQDSKPQKLSTEVITLLKNSALNDPDAGVRREAVNALVRAAGDEATTALLALLNESKDDQVKLLILRRLDRERVGEARVKEKLNELAAHEQSLPIRIAALSALARTIDESAVEKFISIYRSASEPPIKEACLYGLTGTPSNVAKDFLISVAKDDPDPVMRRVALRAVSGSTGKRIMIRTKGAMIDGGELEDLGYFSLGQVPEGLDEMVLQPRADLLDSPEGLADLEKKRADVLAQRAEQLKQRIQAIPLPKIPGEESELEPPSAPTPPELPSNKSTGGPSPKPSPNR